jgi:hypothetical protein
MVLHVTILAVLWHRTSGILMLLRYFAYNSLAACVLGVVWLGVMLSGVDLHRFALPYIIT